MSNSGVEIRPTSIRICFTLDGTPQRHTVKINGKAIKPTPANLKYSTRLAAEIRDRIRFGTFSLAEYFPASGAGAAPLTVGAQLDYWLAGQRIKRSTKAGYQSVINFWMPLIGNKALRALKHSDILAALALRPDLSGKTVNNRVSVLREALELAVLDKAMPDNAAAHIPSATWQRLPVDPFDAEEVERILHGLQDTPQVANYTAFKFFTGLRTGESFGLRWADVDLTRGSILVHQSIVGGEEEDSTKTSVARTVLLNSRAMAALVAQKQHTFIAGQHVFHDPRDNARWGGEPKFRWYWVPVLKRLGIRHRRPYNTRHTYATMMLMAGMRPAFCAGQLGHSREVFDRSYAKWIPGAGDADEMAKLEKNLPENYLKKF